MSESPCYIADGYNEQAFIKEQPRMHKAVRFDYRPMLLEERSQFFEQGRKTDAKESNRRAANLLAKRIIRWDIDTDGKPLAVTADNIIRLRPVLFERLLGIVVGIDGGDEDPQWNDEESEDAEAIRSEADRTGASVGAAREARDEKN